MTETQLEPVAIKAVPMFETTSKYDVVLKGQVIKLKLDPCKCGVHAMWVVEVPVRDALPDGLKELAPPDKTITKVIDDWHFEPKWWERYILRRTLEKELRKWIAKSRKTFLDIQNSERLIDDLWSRL